MTNDFWNHVARRPRHPGCTGIALRVELKTVGGGPGEIVGRLVDLSRGGVQVAAVQRLKDGQVVRVRLRDEEHVPLIELEAVVRWARIVPEANHWHMGLCFAQELDFATLGELFLNRVLQDDAEAGPASLNA